MRQKIEHSISLSLIESFTMYLREQEKSSSTIERYKHNLITLYKFLKNEPVTKNKIIEWKEYLV